MARGRGEEADAVGELSDEMQARIEEEMAKKEAFFSHFSIGDAGAVYAAEKLRGNTIVEELRLIGCGIGAVGARALSESLGEHNATLKILYLDVNEAMGDDGVEAMTEMVKKNKTLDWLDLSFCGFGAGGARALGEALKENDAVKVIFLSGNKIGDEGAEALAEALRWNESLKRLGLAGCGFGPRGARALAEALKENDSLKDIYLGANDLGDEGAEAFAGALRWNESLQTLYLANCKLTDVGAASLLSALRESNSTLTELDLERNDSLNYYKIKASIEASLKENKAVPASAEHRARCLLFCCLKLAPSAHEHVVPSIGAVPVPVMQYAVEHAGELYVAKRFEVGNLVSGQSSAGVHGRSTSFASGGDFGDLQPATARRR